MPDITMCHGKECPLKEGCYRYKATPDHWIQSFFMVPPYKSERTKQADALDYFCKYFVEHKQEN